MAIGEGAVKRQAGGRGMFGVVRLEVILMELPPRLVITADDEVKSNPDAVDYLPAVTMGIRYALEQVGRNIPSPNVAVRVLQIRSTVCDSNELTMMYAAALAVWNALELQPRRPIELEAESRTLKLPV